MAASDGLDGCLQRGRSQSDPNILTEPGIELAHGTGRMLVSLCLLFYLLFGHMLLCPFLFGDAKTPACPVGCQSTEGQLAHLLPTLDAEY